MVCDKPYNMMQIYLPAHAVQILVPGMQNSHIYNFSKFGYISVGKLNMPKTVFRGQLAWNRLSSYIHRLLMGTASGQH